MILFGFSSTPRNGDALHSPCAHCGETAQVSMRKFRYFHLSFLPVLPLGSTKGVTCGHCQKTTWGREAADIIENGAQYDDELPARPFWHFIGPAAAACLALFIAFSGPSDRSIRSAEAAASPAIGDVWIVRMEDVLPDIEIDLTYGVGRVDEITGDQVFLGFSDWQYDGFLQALVASKKAVEEGDQEYFTEVGVWFDRDDIVGFEDAHDFILAMTKDEQKS